MLRVILAVPLVVCASVVALAQLPSLAERDPIAYSKATPTDAVARLQQSLDRGEATLEFDAKRGYLPSVLKHLDVPVSSQGLVFSRTSLQVDRIAPWSPRAVYFNDDVYVGWVPEGPIMEVASVDPNLGAVFYTLTQTATDHPKFERQTRMCLVCHESAATTGGVPGFLVRSVFADRYGYALSYPGMDESVTTDQTPIADRWGGWYVTGTIGSAHRGNLVGPMLAHEFPSVKNYVTHLDFAATSRVTDLQERLDLKRYLSPHSDLVALLLLAHQTSVHNLMTVANYESRVEGESSPRAAAAIEHLVRALLFVNEAPLSGPATGTSGFAAAFAARGPRDDKGRSLRDLDLKDRLFRYPVSYLIYSESFDALPVAVRQQVYRRVRDVLTGADTHPEFARTPPADRAAALEILSSTKPDFASLAQQTQPF
jgi:hypothetical protein